MTIDHMKRIQAHFDKVAMELGASSYSAIIGIGMQIVLTKQYDDTLTFIEELTCISINPEDFIKLEARARKVFGCG